MNYRDPHSEESSSSTFTAGSLDLFTSAQIGDEFQILTEVVAEFVPDENEVAFEVERIYGAWIPGDRFSLKIGREHSPTSQWARLYHHGQLFWPAATQPFLARFEDFGGPLPIHQVGLEVGGRIRAGGGTLRYVGAVTNGRGLTPEDVTNASDRNSSKAVDLGVSFSPATQARIDFGINLYRDTIPPDPLDTARAEAMRESIGTLHVSLQSGSFDLLAEAAWIDHQDRLVDETFSHRSAYVQAGLRRGEFVPYARYDVRSMERDDPFFTAGNLDLDRWEGLLGLRYEPGEHAALKVEAGYGRGEERDGLGTVERRSFRAASVRLTWGF